MNAQQTIQTIRDLVPLGLADYRLPEPVSPAALERGCAGLMASGIGRAYGCFGDDLKPQGILVGMVIPDPKTGNPHGIEHLWWVAPAARGAASFELMRAFESDCESEGCSRVSFGFFSNVGKSKAMRRMYTRQGYQEYNVTVSKEL